MIKVSVLKENRKYKKITILGHAMYDDYGKDIVCAGVSTILTTTVNAILKFNDQAIELSQEKDIVLTVLSEDEVTSKLLENMVDLLYELEESYPKNIAIRKRDNWWKKWF